MTHVTCRLTAKPGISSGTIRSVIEYGLPFHLLVNYAALLTKLCSQHVVTLVHCALYKYSYTYLLTHGGTETAKKREEINST